MRARIKNSFSAGQRWSLLGRATGHLIIASIATGLLHAMTIQARGQTRGDTPNQGQNGPACDSRDRKYDERFASENVRLCSAELENPALPVSRRAIIFNIRGNLYDALREYDLAIADYTEVIQLGFAPLIEYAYANRAFEKCREADYQAALIDYNAAVRINPANAWALYGRGVARLRSGDIQGGNNDLQKANGLDPDIHKTYEEVGFTP